MQTLLVQSGDSYRVATSAEVAEVAGANALAEFNRAQPMLSAPRAAVEYLRSILTGRDAESFVVIFLNNRQYAIACEEMFRGTIDGATVHPREVVKACLWKGAAAVIFAHNHPSGVAEPGQADELITRRLREALALIDVRVVDHFVIGGTGSWCSMAERGMI